MIRKYGVGNYENKKESKLRSNRMVKEEEASSEKTKTPAKNTEKNK